MQKKLIVYLLLATCAYLLPASFIVTEANSSDYRSWTTADHNKIDLLQQKFGTPEEVTSACIFCHTDASKQIHDTIHWSWECGADKTGKMGKGGITMNNF
ncbi:MAG: hypothetical protein RBR53_05245 [Desulforegulaceae bacterium]|nr:hypothetical protein [Desulforegulaceae bacterium]